MSNCLICCQFSGNKPRYLKHLAFVPAYFLGTLAFLFDRANASMSFNAPSLTSL